MTFIHRVLHDIGVVIMASETIGGGPKPWGVCPSRHPDYSLGSEPVGVLCAHNCVPTPTS